MIVKKLTLLVTGLLLVGCGVPYFPPKLIQADGITHIACKGIVWVSHTSGMFSEIESFKLHFTESSGRSVALYSVKNLIISDPPVDLTAPFPINPPDPKISSDLNGKPFTQGLIYTWPDGSKARLKNGLWAPVKVNDDCG